jgi:ligand-binding SRPBCC domain-containing protein
MPVIRIQTDINAPLELCFDLARSIDFHKVSMAHTGERATAGRISGLIENGETVTWSAVHLGIRQELESVITAMDRPTFFCDEMVKGAFKSFRHEHHFLYKDGKTQMRDIFTFQSPLGPIGWLANWLFLSAYMLRFLEHRNNVLKTCAESGEGQRIINVNR